MKHFSFFTNWDCEYFPCHTDTDPKDFNCLFCYCPLYVFGDRCGGKFLYLEDGRKDCTNCTFPHKHDNYQAVISRYNEILAVTHPPEKEIQSDLE